jgi:twitching motility protein PilT
VAALDSLLGLIELRKAEGLVLVGARIPSLLGGTGGGALTMPPLDPSMMQIFLDEVLSEEERGRLTAGELVEREHQSERFGTFVVKARLENGAPKLVVRKSARRAPGPSAKPTASTPPAPRDDGKPSQETPVRPGAEPPPAVNLELPAPLEPAESHATGAAASASPELRALLARALAEGASDVILSVGRPPVFKIRGQLVEIDGPALNQDDLVGLLGGALHPARQATLARTGSVDLALQLGSTAVRGPRFRVNVFRQLEGLAAVLRPITDRVPSLEDLHLPRALLRTTNAPHGLVLMAGPTGSGKSTTLAALVEHVCLTRACHVVTLEDPIEYVFSGGRALVHQREVGTHVDSFATGLRAALRESPDVLLLGEMRDPETMTLALTAAETGHLVLSTLHAGSAAGAVDRILNAFSEGQRNAIRTQLAGCLRFLITQHLLPSVDGGRTPAVEFLAVNHAIAAQIRDGRTQLLLTQMELGADEGMVTLESALAELVRTGRITRQTALSVTVARESLERVLAEGSRAAPGPRLPR